MTLTVEFDLDNVKFNQRAKYLGHSHLVFQRYCPDRADVHTGPKALTGPLHKVTVEDFDWPFMVISDTGNLSWTNSQLGGSWGNFEPDMLRWLLVCCSTNVKSSLHDNRLCNRLYRVDTALCSLSHCILSYCSVINVDVVIVRLAILHRLYRSHMQSWQTVASTGRDGSSCQGARASCGVPGRAAFFSIQFHVTG